MIDSGELEMNRKDQRALWMWNYIKYEVLEMFKKHPSVIANVPAYEKHVKEGSMTPGVAADQLLRLYSELK